MNLKSVPTVTEAVETIATEIVHATAVDLDLATDESASVIVLVQVIAHEIVATEIAIIVTVAVIVIVAAIVTITLVVITEIENAMLDRVKDRSGSIDSSRRIWYLCSPPKIVSCARL